MKIKEKEVWTPDLASGEEMLLIGCPWSEICAGLKTDTQTIAETVQEKYGESLQAYTLRHRQKSRDLILKEKRERAKTSNSIARFLKSINIGPVE